jgi:DNA polymerase-3 subunit delta
LTAKPVVPVYVIHGDEAYLATESLNEIIRQVLGPEGDRLGLSEHDGDDVELATVLDDLRTPSLLTPQRLVVVRSADEFVTTHREALERFLDAPAESGILVLLVESWPSNRKLYKRVERIGRNIAAVLPRGVPVQSWARDHARARFGCELVPAAANRLAELIGRDLGRLNSELAKLATYVGPRTRIEEADVNALVGMHREEKVFALCDALAAGDGARAMQTWSQVLESDKDAAFWALPALAPTLRRWIEARRAIDRGESLAAVRERLKLFAPPTELARQLRRFPLGRWEGFLLQLCRTDVAVKTGIGSFESGVERLIVTMCSSR